MLLILTYTSNLMSTLENPALNEELVGPIVCWLEIERNLKESKYDIPALMFVLQPGPYLKPRPLIAS